MFHPSHTVVLFSISLAPAAGGLFGAQPAQAAGGFFGAQPAPGMCI